jgi:hypothetical protein
MDNSENMVKLALEIKNNLKANLSEELANKFDRIFQKSMMIKIISDTDDMKSYYLLHKELIDIKNINTLIQNNKKILILVVNDVPKNDENISIDSIVENLNKTFKNHIDLNNVIIQVIPKISEILYEKNYKISSNLMRDQIFYITKAFSWRAVGTLDTIFLELKMVGFKLNILVSKKLFRKLSDFIINGVPLTLLGIVIVLARSHTLPKLFH